MDMKKKQSIQPKMGSIYNLSRAQLEEVKKTIDEHISQGLIRPSISTWESPVISFPKRTSH